MDEYNYKFTQKAFKKLSRLPQHVRRRIFAKLDFFCQINPILFAEKLTDSSLGKYRFRVGDYRIIFDIEQTTIFILTLGHRREIYR